MLNKIPYFLICLFILLNGCLLSGPDSSRININDPDSPFFFPQISDLNTSISSTDRSLIITWRDDSSFNEGFLIEKKFSQNENYRLIDTVKSPFFTEPLQQYSTGMTYRISTFYLNEESIKRGLMLESDSLDFGDIRNVGVFSSNDTVFVQWFRRTAFDDLTDIEFKISSESKWETIKTIENSEAQDNFIRTNFTLPKGASYNFRIKLYLESFSGNLENFHTSRIFTLTHN